MATQQWHEHTDSGSGPGAAPDPDSDHHTAGYCCVLLAASYVIAIALLVGYLIASLLL